MLLRKFELSKKALAIKLSIILDGCVVIKAGKLKQDTLHRLVVFIML